MVRNKLRASGIHFAEGEVVALKRQKVFCGGAFRVGAYF
jgi:hypothetical protein